MVNKFNKLLDIGISLSSEKDYNNLLEIILDAAMDFTNCDAGTLYIYKDNMLYFKNMITKSLNIRSGGNGEEINLPPVKLVKENVCAEAVLLKTLINVHDVYDDKRFDFTGPKKYDAKIGYHTKSVLVVPMQNDKDEIIGVLQLINAINESGEIVPFSTDDELIIKSLASQAAITITNMNYSKQIIGLLYGFVRVMSTGIDARTPYNANHTKNMVKYAQNFFDYESKTNGKYKVSDTERNEIILSIWLHDIGKLVTPLEIMDKSTRLGCNFDELVNRFGRIDLLTRLSYSNKEIDEVEFNETINGIKSDLEFIKDINNRGYLSDDRLERVKNIGKKTYKELDGKVHNYLTLYEIEQLSIKEGTLTRDEKRIMEGHVTMTRNMLNELDFPSEFSRIPEFCGCHHEYINGTGYPKGLKGDELSWQIRFITILDVFEALTAKDRPYKLPKPVEEAFAILDEMVLKGQLDNDILMEFKTSHAYD